MMKSDEKLLFLNIDVKYTLSKIMYLALFFKGLRGEVLYINSSYSGDQFKLSGWTKWTFGPRLINRGKVETINKGIAYYFEIGRGILNNFIKWVKAKMFWRNKPKVNPRIVLGKVLVWKRSIGMWGESPINSLNYIKYHHQTKLYLIMF